MNQISDLSLRRCAAVLVLLCAGAAHAQTTASTTTVTASPTSGNADITDTVTFTATVTGSGGTPSGTVTFTDTMPNPDVILCTGVAMSGGSATCDHTFTGDAGDHDIEAAYSGDSSFDPSTGTLDNYFVKGTTTTTLSFTSPAVVGETVTFNVSVAGSGFSGNVDPAGSVVVKADSVMVCTANLTGGNSNTSTGSCTASFPSVGNRSMTAEYAGDSNYTGSTDGPDTLTVNKADTTLEITSSGSSVALAAFTVTWTVTVDAPGSGTPTGTVTVTWGSDSCTNVPVANGQCDITPTSVGTNTLMGSYSGDSNFNSDTDNSESHTVDKADSDVTIDSISPTTPNAFSPFTVNVSVASVDGTGVTPGGNVSVSIDTSPPDNCTASLTSGSGSCDLTAPESGTFTVTASYGGDENHNADGTDATQSVTVNDADIDFNAGKCVTVSSSNAACDPGRTSVTPGSSIRFKITIGRCSDLSDCSNTGDGVGQNFTATLNDDVDDLLLQNVAWSLCPDETDAGQTGDPTGTCEAEVVSMTGDIVDQTITLASGASVIGFVTATVRSDASGSLTNDATISLDAGQEATDGTPGNDTGTAGPFNAEVSTDLVVTHDDVGSTVAGESLSYTFTVANQGFVSADGVQVETKPTGMDASFIGNPGFLAGSVSWQCQASGGACCVANGTASQCGTTSPTSPTTADSIDQLVDLPASSAVTFTISGTVDPASTGMMTSEVQATLPVGIEDTVSTTTDPSSRTESASDDITISQVADLTIDKTVNGPLVDNNDGTLTATYRIVVTNNGPSRVEGADVLDRFDASGFEPNSVSWDCDGASASDCTPSGDTDAGMLSLAVDLDPGQSIGIDATALIDDSTMGSVINSVSVSVPGGVTDPVPTNNSDDAEAKLSATADLSVTVSGASVAVPGEEYTYGITVNNDGPDAVFGARVVDLFPFEAESVSWTCEAKTPIPGDLTFLNSYSGVTGASDVVVSPDGSHVYATAAGGNALISYTRVAEPGTGFGELTPLGSAINGSGNVSDMEMPVSVAMSPDGRHVYVAAETTGSLVLFTRDAVFGSPTFGQLTFQTSFTSAEDPELAGVQAVTISPDGRHVYAAGASGVIAFDRDSASGALTTLQAISSMISAAPKASLAVSSDGAFVAHGSNGGVTVYLRDADSGSLSFGELTSSDSDSAVAISGVSFVASEVGLSLYGGSPNNIEHWVVNTGDGTLGTRDSTSVSSFDTTDVFAAPDGEHVFAVGTSDALKVFRRTPTTGSIAIQQTVNHNGVPLEDASAVVLTGDGRHVLATAAASNVVTVFDREPPEPLFGLIEVEKSGVDDAGDSGGTVVGLDGASAVAVSVDGNHVYGTGFSDNTITGFVRDPDLGLDIATAGQHLTFLETVQEASMDEPVDVVIAPADDYLYVAAQASNSLHVFSRQGDGTVTAIPGFTLEDGDSSANGTVNGLLGVTAVALDPSGEFLYAAGRFDAAIGIFDVNRATGELTYLGAAVNGVDGVASLLGVFDVAVTADGKYLIAAASEDDAVVVFERITDSTDPDFGGLRFLQALPLSDSRPLGLALSNDHVYVAGASADAVFVLARDSETGRVRLIQTFSNGDSGSTALDGPRALALSNDASKLFVVAEGGDAALVFSRNTDDVSSDFGFIEFLEETINTQNGVTGLDRPYDVAVAPSGGNAYIVGLDSSALAAFRLGVGSSCTAAGSGSIDDTVTVAAGGALSYSATLQLRSDALGGGTQCRKLAGDEAASNQNNLCNFAEIIAVGVTDSNGGQSDTHNSAVLTPEADLQISKTNSQVSAVPGERVVYTIEIVNNGPSDAVHNLPSSVTFTDALSGQFNLDETNWTCDAVGSGGLAFVEAQNVVSRDDTENPAVEMSLLSGVSSVITIPDPDATGPLGDLVLAANPTLSTVSLFERDAVTGEITPQLVLQDSASFNPDARVGGADIIESVTGLSGARALAATGDGRYVFLAAQAADAIYAFEVGSNSGSPTLTRVATATGSGLNQPVALAYDAANDRLYVAASNSDAVSAFSFDTGTETFSLLDLEVDNVDDADDGAGVVSGLNGATSVVLSPESDFLFAAGRDAQQIVRFAVNEDGTLVFEEALDSTAVGTSLSGLSRLHLSADGSKLFASATGAGSVGVFSVDGQGELSLLQEVDSTTVNSGRFSAPGPVIDTGDGRHLYIGARDGDAIFALRFDMTAGNYIPVSIISGAMDSNLGLDEPRALAFDAESRFLYVAGASAPAVSVFERQDDSDCQVSGDGAPQSIPLRIAAGGRVVFQVDTLVEPDASGTLSNTATVDAAIDATPGESSSTDEDILNRRADLAITKTDDRAEFDGLAGAADVVVADGLHVYVAGRDDAGIGRFLRQDEPSAGDFGFLEFIGAVRQGEDGATGLLGVADLNLSNDGLILVAAGADSNALSIFDRDPVLGTLTQRRVLVNGDPGISGLTGASASDFSGDDHHFYAVGASANALSVHEIESGTGIISQIQVIQDGTMGVNGLTLPSDVVVAPDDKHVYVAAPGSDSVLAFTRNPSDGSATFGQLTFVDRYQDQDAGIDGLAGVRSIALSPDGNFLYALGSREASLVVFSRDPASGELTFVERKADGTGGVNGLSGARRLSVTSDGARIYVAAAASDAVVWFDVAMDGTLTFGDSISSMSGGPDGLAGATAVAVVDPHLYVSASEDNAVTTLSVNGSISVLDSIIDGRGGVAPGSQLTYRIEVFNHGPSDVVGARVTDVFPSEFESIQWTCTPDGVGAGCRVCTSANLDECSGDISESVDLPADTSVLFEATGLIRPGVTGRLANTASVAAPAGVTDGFQSNNSATDDDTVMAPAADVALDLTAVSGTPVAGAPADFTVAVSNAGPSVARNTRVRVTLPELMGRAEWTCSASPTPGLLTLIEEFGTELTVVRGFAVSPDGRHVYAVGDDSGGNGAIAVLDRDSSSGRLSTVSLVRDGVGAQGVGGAADVVVSPEGDFVFVAGAGDDAVAAFARDGSDGSLTFVNHLIDGVDAEGLGDVAALALTPDGFYLYAASPTEDAVAILRVGSDGSLSFVNRVFQGEGSIDGLNGATDLVVSPDGRHLYVIGVDNDGVAIFSRSPSTGQLSFEASILDFQITGGGLLGPVDVATDSEGSRVFVAAQASHVVSVFDRNDETGALSFALRVEQSSGGGGLTNPAAISVTADGRLLQVSHDEGITSYQIREEALRPIQTLAAVPTEPASARGLSGGGEGRFLYAASADNVATLKLGDGSFCSETGSGPVDDIVDLSAGGNVTYSIQGLVLPGARGDLVVAASAEVSSEAADPVPDNNAETVDQPVVVSSPVGVIKSDGETSVVAGEAIRYTIDLSNTGLSDALNVQVTDMLPTLPGMPAGLVSNTIGWTCTDQRPFGAAAPVSLPGLESLGTLSAAALSTDEDHLAVVSSSGALVLLARDINGVLTEVDMLTTDSPGDDGMLTALAGAAAVTFDPSGRFLFVAAADSNAVLAFEIDADSGLLVHLGTIVSSSQNPGLVGARTLAMSSDGQHLYVGSGTGDSVAILEWRAGSRTLNHLERIRDGLGDLTEVGVIDGPLRVIAQPSGRFVHVLSDGVGALATFRRDPDTGLLQLVEVLRSGSIGGALSAPENVLLSPNGVFAYVFGNGVLARLSVDPETGESSFETSGTGQAPVAINHDGRLVLATVEAELTAWRRDPATGELSPLGGLGTSADVQVVVTAAGEDAYLIDSDGVSRATAQPFAYCKQTSGAGDVDIPVDIGAGGSIQLVVDATVDSSARGTLENTAAANDPRDGITPVQTDATDQSDVDVVTELSVAIEPLDASPVAGTEVTFALVVANDGPSAALGAPFAFTAGAELQDITWTCTGPEMSTCPQSGTGAPAFDFDLLPGESATVVIRALVDSSFIGPTSVEATIDTEPAGTAGTVNDPMPGNNVDVLDFEVIAESDVVVSASPSDDPLVPGTPGSITVTILNEGPSDAPAVDVDTLLDGGVDNLAWTCSGANGGACDAAAGDGDVAATVDLPAGGSVTYLFAFDLPPGLLGQVSMTATAVVQPPVTETDPPDNAFTLVVELEPRADLALTKLALDEAIDAGGQPRVADFELTVSNLGPSVARSVSLLDVYPETLTDAMGTGCVDDGSGTAECVVGDLAVGESVTVAISFNVTMQAMGEVVNEAFATSPTLDPEPANDGDSAIVDIIPGSDLEVILEPVRDATAAAGDVLELRLHVRNVGSGDATDARITLNQPPESSAMSWNCSSGFACTAGLGGNGPIDIVVDVPSGNAYRFDIDLTVDPTVDADVTPFMTLDAAADLTGDINMLNNQDQLIVELFVRLMIDGFEGD